MKILVTGGAGYIGSHFVHHLVDKNHQVCVVDNLSRGHHEALPKSVVFKKTDLLDFVNLKSCIIEFQPEAVVHFAAFAYVGESVEKPDLYYQNNVVGSYNLIKAVVECGVKYFVFSSTCSIYGNPKSIPISEDEPSNPINPYANTKLMIEIMLRDFEKAFGLKNVCLRYFNAAGASSNGLIGESHSPEPHLIPLVLFTAQKKREKIFVFGNDYNTQDGTCIRDYIHVDDLADAHLKAINYLIEGGKSAIINLGTGVGNSVLEIIDKAKNITQKEIPFEIVNRREGDPAILVADNKKAKEILNWQPRFGIDEIIQTAWNWHTNQIY
ncbi:MAG: UDP-glucose 4-epimerase GalE [Melioribacteraceae bacterium]|nr:UDP-glucose 4-epimerase GalE [Melioribacteraceae bacterium]